MKRIAILGGGFAGVTAAWELARLTSAGADLHIDLFEASDRLGGTVMTTREGGYVIEEGPDGWVTEKPWAAQLVRDLGLESELLPCSEANRRTFVLVGSTPQSPGTLRAMPEGMRMMVPSDLAAIDACDLFSAEAKQAYHHELHSAEHLRATAPAQDESVASFVRRHFGDEVLNKIGAPLLSGVLGGDVQTLSVRSVMAPFVAMEREHGSLIAGLQARAAAQGNKPAPAIFTSLRSGVGTLVDRMVAAIPEAWLHRNTSVVSLQPEGDGWRLQCSAGGAGQPLASAERYDAVLLATPAHVTSRLLASIDPRAAALTDMEASSAVVAAFGLCDGASLNLPQGFGFLVPEGSSSRLLACTFVDQKYAHRVPPGGRLLRAFFGGAAAERLMRCSNDEVAAIARMELAHILGPLPEPEIVKVRRLPRSLPQYSVGHLERMDELAQRMEAWPGLSLLGNAYRGVGLPDLARDARAAAQQLLR
ncbi:MAG: protoporphyrinogen oxidase [Acidobacteriota bacterium]|nr:protoporphyrinogen oxidase [Acidobacteriota bacterium]